MARPIRRPSTPNDLEMTDTAMSPVPSPRQPLPTSLASFALSHSTSAPTSPSTSTSIMSIDREDLAWPALLGAAPSFPTIRKLRRSSLLSSRPTDRADHTSSGSGSGSRSTRSGSPINTVFPNWDDEDTKEPSQSPIDQSPADSEEPTASNTDTALRLDTNVSGETTQIPRQMTLDDYGLSSSLPSPMVDKSIDPPSTPRLAPHLGPALVPSPPSSKPIDVPKSSMVRLRPLQYQNQYSHAFADLSTPFPPQHLKPARLIAVLQETNVQEAELQSEASFQRLVASHAELPLAFHPRTPRSARGRFPEEFSAEDDDDRKKDGDDDSDDDDVVFGAPSGESGVAEASAWANDTPAMDVEMASSSGSPSVTSSAMHSVMSTPQPASATPQTLSLSWRDNGGVAAMTGRAPKRKHVNDERFDPYGHPTKRRAISPAVAIPASSTSVASNGVSHPLLHSLSSSPMSTIPRSPIAAMSPYSYSGSVTPGGNGSRSLHSSPILRPVHRLPTAVREKEERERAKAVNGARDGVRSINLSRS